MMSEGQVRVLLNTLRANLNNAQNTTQTITFAGGVSALEMVLEEDS
jgi:hypothetical protein